MQDKKKIMIAKTSRLLGFTTLENEVVLDGLLVRQHSKLALWNSYQVRSGHVRSRPTKIQPLV